MKTEGLVKRKEILHNTDSTSEKGDYGQKKETITHAYGVCVELYPLFNAAKTVSPKYGSIISSYSTEIGVKIGDLVEITIIAGIPSVTGLAKFGFSPKNVIKLNLNPNKDEAPISTLQNEEVPWDESVAEQIGMSPISIVSEMGEKIYNVGLNGIKIGHSMITMFSKLSKISILENAVIIISKQIKIVTKGFGFIGGIRDKLGFKLETIYKEDEDGGLEGVVYEFKGNVSKAMSDIEMTKASIPGQHIDFSKLRLLTLIIDEKLEDYKALFGEVSHQYVNRQLTINNLDDKLDVPINRDFSSVLGNDLSKQKYRAGVVSIKGEERPITYLKAVSLNGDIVEFSAGEANSVYWKRKDVSIKQSKKFDIGKEYIYSQDSSLFSQFPISERSTIMSTTYASHIRVVNGEESVINMGKKKDTLINLSTTFDEDEESNIETVSTFDCKKTITLGQEMIVKLEQEKEGVPAVFNFSLNGDSEESISLSTRGAGLVYTSTKKGISAEARIGLSGIVLATPKNISISCKKGTFNSQIVTFKGRAYFTKGLFSNGDFVVKAKNVTMISEQNIFFKGVNISVLSDKIISATFGSTLSFVASSPPVVKNKTTTAAVLYLTQNRALLNGERAVIQASDSMVVVATNALTMGAKHTSISGLQGQE